MIQVGPYCDVDVFLLFSKEVVEKFFPSFSITDFVMVIKDRVVVSDGFGWWGLECSWLGVFYV